MTRHGIAQEPIPIGAKVLLRGDRVTLAGPELANGVAVKSVWGSETYNVGARVTVDPIPGLGERDLQAMANGPIMDPNRLYLPAGKCSEAEMRERER